MPLVIFSMKKMRTLPIAIRSVFLSLLLVLNVLNVVFTSWNVDASLNAQLNVSVSTILSLLSSVLVFTFLVFGILDFAFPNKNLFTLWCECVLSTIISCLQMGVSIGLTAEATNKCRMNWRNSQCPSVRLLLPVIWTSTVIFLIHCLALIVLNSSRTDLEPNIWASSFSSVYWFDKDSGSSGRPGRPRNSCDVEMSLKIGSTVQDETVAPWAKNIRRGRDAPFKLPVQATSRAVSLSTDKPLPLSLPPQVHFRSASSEGNLQGYRTSPHNSGSLSSLSVDQFPIKVSNSDLPIPLPRRSQWVRAYSMTDLNVCCERQSN